MLGRRHFLFALAGGRRGMQEVMGPLPKKPRGAPAVRVAGEHPGAGYRRLRIDYEAEAGDWVPAWLLLPEGAGRRAGVVCLHQTTRIGKDEPAGLGGKPELHYAHELAQRGFVALAPDYPNFGDYRIDVYARGYASATMKGVVNHRRALDVLAARPEVDARRLAACGHSLGGHNALFLAAFDRRIRAVVTSCGFTRFARYYGGDLRGWSHAGYMPRIAERYGAKPDRMPFDFPDVLRAIAPRALFINAPKRDSNFDVSGVEESVEQVKPLFPAGRLLAEYPDAGHEFPDAIREKAYTFLEKHL